MLFVASESCYYLFAKKLGFKPKFIRHEGQPHWFLAKDSEVIDLTKSQFKTKVPYENGRGIGFLTNKPSKRTKILIDRIKNDLKDYQRLTKLAQTPIMVLPGSNRFASHFEM